MTKRKVTRKADQAKLMAATFVAKSSVSKSSSGQNPFRKRDERTLEHQRHVDCRTKKRPNVLWYINRSLRSCRRDTIRAELLVAQHKYDRLGPLRKRSDPCEENLHHRQYDGFDQERTG